MFRSVERVCILFLSAVLLANIHVSAPEFEEISSVPKVVPLVYETPIKPELPAYKETTPESQPTSESQPTPPEADPDDVMELARIIYAEAGSTHIPTWVKEYVGSVVLNRVASPEFPDSVEEVIYQSGQYSPTFDLEHYLSISPSEECVAIAEDLLVSGSKLPSEVVFQANFKQGSEVYAVYEDPYYGSTYFCVSSYPELYKEEL